ncbi:MAG TPA: DoxX family protein [Candidatus Nanoarchaeia archaeon]|nr:DoxX family protein [Candidatus Nanoarchaeia archaeon]
MKEFLAEHADKSILFLRLGVGIVFLIHGIGKLLNVGPVALGITNTTGFFANLGIPMAGLAAVVVALFETFGGLFILLGIFTRISATLLAINMVVAILLVHLSKGFSIGNGGYEFALLLLLGSISLMLSGPGRFWSLEDIVRKRV